LQPDSDNSDNSDFAELDALSLGILLNSNESDYPYEAAVHTEGGPECPQVFDTNSLSIVSNLELAPQTLLQSMPGLCMSCLMSKHLHIG